MKTTFFIRRAAAMLLPALAFWLFLSCDDLVEVELPQNQLAGAAVFADAQTADAALAGIYVQLRNSAFTSGTDTGLSCLLGHYADELGYYSSSSLPEQAFQQNGLTATNATVALLWNRTYSLVYSANAVIEGVEASAGIPEAAKARLLGEAYFLRGFFHFHLASLYGDVPYVETTDYTANSRLSKLPAGIVCAFATADLEKAAGLLSDAYPAAERSRPNKSATHALLARLHLYAGHWEQAAAAATAVLENPAYMLESSLANVFLKGSRGTIWQLFPAAAGGNTLEAQTFIFTAGPPPNRALSSALVGSFAPGDLRRTAWIGTVTSGTQSWHHAFKYRRNANTGTSAEYSIQLRIEEQYLIRAEARAMLGNTEGAREDLNVIRNRAGLGNTLAVSAPALADAVLAERRWEFFTEHGHRWFDLKRRGQLDAALSGLKPGWDSTDSLLPLPHAELLKNPNLLPQNGGY